MPRPEDTLDRLARLARDDEALHAVSERRPMALSRGEDSAPPSVLPESLTRPISEAQQSSFVDAIQARLASSERRPSAPTLASRAPRRPNALVALGALGALAATVGLLVLRAQPNADEPLSRYELRLEGPAQTERGNTPARLLRLRSSTQLRFELRPLRDERGSVRARAFVQGPVANGARETRELEVTQEQSAAGAVRASGDLPASLPEHGELLLYVGRPSVIERTQPNAATGSGPTPGDAQEFRFQFERVP
jgi:hypothetical protein